MQKSSSLAHEESHEICHLYFYCRSNEVCHLSKYCPYSGFLKLFSLWLFLYCKSFKWHFISVKIGNRNISTFIAKDFMEKLPIELENKHSKMVTHMLKGKLKDSKSWSWRCLGENRPAWKWFIGRRYSSKWHKCRESNASNRWSWRFSEIASVMASEDPTTELWNVAPYEEKENYKTNYNFQTQNFLLSTYDTNLFNITDYRFDR